MLHVTGKIVVLYFGFRFIQIFLYMKKRGVYGDYFIKKRRKWPFHIDDGKIKAHFTKKCVGAVDALHVELENVLLRIFAIK